ncbi:unnamed protein product [Urochloa humidicola]
MFFDDSSSDDDDDFEMMAILLMGIEMDKRAKHGGSVPRRKVVCPKLFDDYSTDEESMVCALSSTTASSATTRKKPLRRLTTTASSRLARMPRAGVLAGHAGAKMVPVMNLSAGEAPMTRRQKRKALTQSKLKVKEVQAGGNSEEKAGTEYGLDSAGPSTRRESKLNPKYLGQDWVL